MVGSLCVSPLNTERSTHLSQKATSYGQRLLPHGHFHKGQLSKNDIVNASTSNERLLNNKRLFYLLTSSNYSPSQQPKNIQSLADTSDSTMTSARSSGSKPSLDDDQILHQIENKLKKFRAQMKALKGRSSSDALNGKASSSPQGSSPITPSASVVVVKAAENITVRSVRDEEHSNGSRQNPGKTRMESAPEGKRMESAPTDKHFTERDRITTAAVRSNMEDKEKDYSMGLRALFGSPLGELVTENLGCTLHHKPPNHEHSGAENDHSTRKDIMKGVNDAATIANSVLSRSPPKLLVCTTCDQQPFGTDSDNENSHTVETSKLSKSNSSAGRENLTLNSSQICNFNKVPDVTSCVTNYQVIEPEPQQKEVTEERMEIGVQVGEGRIEMYKSEWSSILRDPKFEDITDDESDVTQQVSTHENKTQIGVFMQSPNHFTNVKTSTNATSEPAERSTPKQQEPKAPLTCSCPYFVETDDGFEKVPCPKCAQATPLIKQEEQSEESDSEEVILFVTDLVLKDEAIVLDSSDDEGEENVSSAKQQNQNAVFQRVKEFETLDSFLSINKKLPNPLGESQPPLRHSPVEKVDSEQVLPHCSSQNAVEKVSKIAPAPKVLRIFEKFSPKLIQTPCCNKDISSDTDDSSDYPSHTQSNYLTASHLVRAPSPQSYDSSSEEHGEALQSSSEMTSATVLTPDSENEQENNSVNHPTIVSKTTTGSLESTDRSKTPFKKAKYKSRHVRESDSESENDQDGSETCCFSAKNGVAWTQPDVGPVKFGQNFSGLQRFEKSNPISRDLDYDSEGDQVHSKVLNNVDQNTAFKRKNNKTDLKSDTQVKRKRSSLDIGKERAPIMAEQASGSSINAHNANPNLSIEQKPNGKLVSRQPSLPNQRRSVSPPDLKIFDLEGKQYTASSLPLRNHSQPASNSIRKTRPTPQTPPKSHNPFLSSNMNSYSTAKSTPAKQAVVKEWQDNQISLGKERRNGYEAERPRKAQNVKTRHGTAKPRKRHNSQQLQTPLMKKTKLQALTLTNAVHHKESTRPSQANIGERYKWKEKKPVKDHIDDEWLDRMHGEVFQRPHH